MSQQGRGEHWLGKGHPQETAQGGGGLDVGGSVVDPECVCVKWGPGESVTPKHSLWLLRPWFAPSGSSYGPFTLTPASWC